MISDVYAFRVTNLSRVTRRKHPLSYHDPYFGFVIRVLVGLMAVFASLVVAMLWGAVNGWQVTTSLLVVQGVLIVTMVLFGEHLRSRAFEREFDRAAGPMPDKIKLQGEVADLLSTSGLTETGLRLRHNRILKRGFELFCAISAVTFLLPLFLVIAIFIKIESRGPILFTVVRYDFSGRKIITYKFRTMKLNGFITPFGNLLRRTNLDELPSLLSVISGNYSLIGPKASREKSDLFKDGYLLNLRPGLLDHIGERYKIVDESVYYDLWRKYVQSWSLSLDISVLSKNMLLQLGLIYRV